MHIKIWLCWSKQTVTAKNKKYTYIPSHKTPEKLTSENQQNLKCEWNILRFSLNLTCTCYTACNISHVVLFVSESWLTLIKTSSLEPSEKKPIALRSKLMILALLLISYNHIRVIADCFYQFCEKKDYCRLAKRLLNTSF